MRELIEKIYWITQEDLHPSLGSTDHIEYIEYRLNGGDLNEEGWFLSLCD